MTVGPAGHRPGEAAPATSGWGPVGYLWRLLREGAVIARCQWVASLVAAAMAGGVCVAVLATTGQSATTENSVLARLDDVSGRVVRITDQTGEAQISPATVSSIARLSGVESVVGFGPAFDVHQASLGENGPPVPARFLYGRLPRQVRLTRGVMRPGSMVVGQAAQRMLGLAVPAGGVIDDDQLGYSVVGGFTATGYLSFLSGSAMIRPTAAMVRSDPDVSADTGSGGTPQPTLSNVYVLAATARDVPGLVQSLPDAVVAQEQKFTVSAPVALIRARAVVSDQLAKGSRTEMVYVLLGGLVLEAVTMLGAVSQRRRDFGRRRALGASRSAVVVLVLAQTVVPCLVGVVVGSAAGLVVVHRLTGALPPWTFTLGLAALALLCAAAAAVPPAVSAALRDPVRILRVP